MPFFQWDYLQGVRAAAIILLLSGSSPLFTHVSGRRFDPAFLKVKVLALHVFFD